jgi:ClpP class serine protease
MLGKVTNTEMANAQHTLDTMHKAFQQLVARGRPQLEENIDDVCNGDIYFGENAKRLSLVDRIVTSEEYLLERIQAGDRVMKLHRVHQYVVGRRKLIHPLDFLRERSVPLRAACARWLRSDLESTLSGIVAATGVMGAIQFLVQNIIMRGRDSGFY